MNVDGLMPSDGGRRELRVGGKLAARMMTGGMHRWMNM